MAKKPKEEPKESNPYETPEFKETLKKILSYKPLKKIKPKARPQG